MKTIPLRLITAIALIIETVYAVSVILTREAVTLILILTAIGVLKFIIRTTLYLFFKLLKWAVIIALIGLLFASLM
jgi:hypothetical protein